MALRVKAGSANETDANGGTAKFAQAMAFKGAGKRSDLRLYRDSEDMGITVSCNATREHITYYASCMDDFAEDALTMLTETAFAPRIALYEVVEGKRWMTFANEDATSCRTTMTLEGLHKAAFSDQSPLGRSLYGENVSKDKLEAFLKDNYHPSQMTLSAVGISHTELVTAVEGLLGGDSPASLPAVSSSPFVGGDSRIYASGEDTTVALAWASDSSAEYQVLSHLLGEDSFLNSYSTCGLIGISATTTDAESLVNDTVSTFKGAATASPAVLAAAKLQAKMAIAGPLDSKTGTLEVMISGVDVGGCLAAIDAVTTESLAAAVSKSLAGGVAISSIGNIESVPRAKDF